MYKWKRDQITDPNDPQKTIDDPLDEPPAEVIAYEQSSVIAFASLGGVVESNNGLGFQAITGSNEFDVWSTSSGTLYTKRAGGEEITLTCSPSGSALDPLANASLSVWYNSAILTPRVVLAGTTRFSNPEAVKFLTGQQITGSITPVDLAITSYSWQVPGAGSFKDYVYWVNFVNNTSEGRKVMHTTAADKAGSTFSFYTNEAGEVTVQCDLKFTLPPNSKWAGGLPDFTAKSLPAKSVRPIYFNAKLSGVQTGTVNLEVPNNRFIFGGGQPPSPGQKLTDVSFASFDRFTPAGRGCFVQLITANRHIYRNASQGYYSHFTYQRTQALDTNFPYPYNGEWSMPATGTFEDSPSQPLNLGQSDGGGNDWYRSTASDSMQVWVMFKPEPSAQGQATTWIPMAKYMWAWNGTAEKQSGTWSLLSGGGLPSSPPGPWTIHPGWTTFSPSPFFLYGVYP